MFVFEGPKLTSELSELLFVFSMNTLGWKDCIGSKLMFWKGFQVVWSCKACKTYSSKQSVILLCHISERNKEQMLAIEAKTGRPTIHGIGRSIHSFKPNFLVLIQIRE